MAFAAGELAKLPAYWKLGKLGDFDWRITARLMAIGMVGIRIGRAVSIVLSEVIYLRTIEALLFLLSVILLGNGGWIMLAIM